jgi:acetyltransferase
MTVRNLNKLFKPKSVALIGASKSQSSVGAVLARNLLKAGFDGPVMPVNPRHQAIEGHCQTNANQVEIAIHGRP